MTLPHWISDFATVLHLPLTGGVLYLVARAVITDYQHKMVWADYKKRHNIPNGDK